MMLLIRAGSVETHPGPNSEVPPLKVDLSAIAADIIARARKKRGAGGRRSGRGGGNISVGGDSTGEVS